MHRPLRHSQLIDFENPVAGHPGVLSDRDGEFVVKPCAQSEIDFYQTTSAHPEFEYYIPTFIGTLTLPRNITEVASTFEALQSQTQPAHPQVEALAHALTLQPPSPTTLEAQINRPWTPSAGKMIKTDLAIVLENIASGFSQPNILDVKIGSRLWADDAPLLKRQKLDKVASETTSGSLGYRIAGMKTWHGPEQGYLKYDKFYGRGFSVGTVREGWCKYFLPDVGDGKAGGGVTCRSSRKIIKRCLGDLRGLLEVMVKEESRMYSASLLFVYEGDGAMLEQKFIKEKEMFEQLEKNENGVSEDQAEEEGEEEDDNSDSEETLGQPRIQAVKVIDFAHASWTPGAGPDENFLRGIRHVILALEGLL